MNNVDFKFYDEEDIYTYNFLKDASDDLIAFFKCEIDKLFQYPKVLPLLIDKNKRNNIDFLNLSSDADVLMVNDCFCIYSDYICDKVKSLTVMELSKLTSDIIETNLERKQHKNYKIYVGKPNVVKFDKKFDYIILNDILEFSQVFFEKEENPYKALIEYFKGFLKKDGRLILEINNRFGLKNWQNLPDDITSKPFSALQSYIDIFDIKTFSKSELDDLFEDCSFKHVQYFYPVMSKNNTNIILSDNYPDNYYIEKNIIDCYKNDESEKGNLYPEFLIVKDLFKEQKFKFFANSFIVILSDKKLDESVLYSKFSNKFTISVIKKEDKLFVQKTPKTDSAKIMIQNDCDFYEYEKNRLKEYEIQNIEVVKTQQENGNILYDFVDGTNMDYLIADAMKTIDEKKIVSVLDEYKAFLYYLYPNFKVQDYKPNNVAASLFGACDLKMVACVEKMNINLTLDNIFKKDNNYIITNAEGFYFDILPLNYVLASAIFKLASNYGINYENSLMYLKIHPYEIDTYKTMYDKFNQRRGF